MTGKVALGVCVLVVLVGGGVWAGDEQRVKCDGGNCEQGESKEENFVLYYAGNVKVFNLQKLCSVDGNKDKKRV